MNADAQESPREPRRGLRVQRTSQSPTSADRPALTLREAMVAESLADLVQAHQSILATEQRLIALNEDLSAQADKIEQQLQQYGKVIQTFNQAGYKKYAIGLVEQTRAAIQEVRTAVKQELEANRAAELSATQAPAAVAPPPSLMRRMASRLLARLQPAAHDPWALKPAQLPLWMRYPRINLAITAAGCTLLYLMYS